MIIRHQPVSWFIPWSLLCFVCFCCTVMLYIVRRISCS